MKVSKALLQAVAVAVTIGIANSSCTKVEEKLIEKKNETGGKCIIKEKPSGSGGDCPACGMG